MTKKIKDVTFDMMPFAHSMVTYADALVLYDNLDMPISQVMTPMVMEFLSDLPKRIDFTVVLLCVKGHIEVDYNLQQLRAGEGDLLILVPGTIAERLEFDPNSTIICLSVPDQELAPGSSSLNAVYVQKNFTSPMCLHLDHDVLHSGIESYQQLKRTLLTMGDKVNSDLVKAYIMVMAGLAAVNFQKYLIAHPEDKKNTKERVLKQFLTDIEEHHREHRDVAFYAQKAGLSPKYFAKIIHTTSQRHPLDWIKGYVILDAKSLLKSRQYSIGQICEMLNFPPGGAQFNRYFKEATGLSPTEYARSSKD